MDRRLTNPPVMLSVLSRDTWPVKGSAEIIYLFPAMAEGVIEVSEHVVDIAKAICPGPTAVEIAEWGVQAEVFNLDGAVERVGQVPGAILSTVDVMSQIPGVFVPRNMGALKVAMKVTDPSMSAVKVATQVTSVRTSKEPREFVISGSLESRVVLPCPAQSLGSVSVGGEAWPEAPRVKVVDFWMAEVRRDIDVSLGNVAELGVIAGVAEGLVQCVDTGQSTLKGVTRGADNTMDAVLATRNILGGLRFHGVLPVERGCRAGMPDRGVRAVSRACWARSAPTRVRW